MAESMEAHLDGHIDDAAARFLDAIAQVRATGDTFTSADLSLILGECLPGRPETIGPLKAAREVYAKVGARPLLDRVEAALAGRPVGTPTAGPAVAGEAV